MATARKPVGASEPRHVTKIAEHDLVWDEALGRWRRVTSVWHYVADRTQRDMVKVVLDLSAVHRHDAGDETYYDVLLDDVVAPEVRPLSATERRRATRRGEQDDDDASGSGRTQAATASSADKAAVSDVVATATMPTASSSNAPATASRQVDQPAGERERREALRLSRADLAGRSGLTVSALWRVENGRGKDTEIAQVRDALNIEEARHAAGK